MCMYVCVCKRDLRALPVGLAGAYTCVRACVCVCARARACLSACVCVCMCVCIKDLGDLLVGLAAVAFAGAFECQKVSLVPVGKSLQQ